MMEKSKPADISTDAANASASRDSEFHTVSPISPLFEENTNEPHSQAQTPPSSTVPTMTITEMEVPPPKPPRPISPGMQAQLTLSEAFPTVEASVIKAVLIASRGQVEPAFEALLAMTDPSYVPEAPALASPHSRGPPRAAHSPRVDSRYPPQSEVNVPRGSTERLARRQGGATSTPRNQLEADEMYARQLAEHFESHGYPSGGRLNQSRSQHRRQQSEDDEYDSEKEHSFLDDDLPIIKENIRQGFLQTQEKVNKWVTDFKKRLDGDTPSPETSPPPSRNTGSGSGYTRGPARHPRENVYDADPRVIGDDFAHLELRDNTAAAAEAPRRPPRPIANPSLFQQSTNSSTSGPRKVSFQDTIDEDDELYRRSPKKPSSPAPAVPSKTTTPAASKWEPLKAVEPAPMDGDPFSLGDSEDERERDEAKGTSGTTGPEESGVKDKA